MDFNFADLKKEAAEDILPRPANAVKQTPSGSSVSYDLLSSASGTTSGSGLSAGQQDDNAHTEQYFSNAQRDLDFEHVDPQTFVQRMSASAKEAQEKLEERFADHHSGVEDVLTHARDAGSQGLAAMTNDFMNAERSFFGGVGDPKPAAKPAANIFEEDLLGDGPVGDGQFAASAPAASNSNFDSTFNSAPLAKSSASNKDSDTDSPSVSYNPSPVKKQTVTAALKEQDNEKFISSEDLLGDFKEERTATPDFKPASDKTTATVTSGIKPAPIQITDLDDDEDFMPHAKHASHAATVHSQFEDVKDLHTTAATKPTPAPLAAVAAVPVVKPAAPVIEPVKQQPTPVAKVTTPTEAKTTKDNKDQQPNIVSVQEIFYKYGLDAWFKPERLHPRVESLIYWRDVKKSGIVFGAGLITLLAISCFSVISVFAYLSFFTLFGTIAFRIYKSVMQAIQKTSDGHPFKEFLEYDLTLSQEKVQNIVGIAVAHVNGFTAELRRLFLVEDLVDSLKFGVILWVLTYIGAWFNGMTLVILAFVSLFTLPKVYENNKQSIDTYLELVQSKFTEITDKIKTAIPIGNKKPIAAETDKDK